VSLILRISPAEIVQAHPRAASRVVSEERTKLRGRVRRGQYAIQIICRKGVEEITQKVAGPRKEGVSRVDFGRSRLGEKRGKAAEESIIYNEPTDLRRKVLW